MVVTGIILIRTQLMPPNRTKHRKVVPWLKSVSPIPEPDSRGPATASPKDNVCSQNNDTEPSDEEAPIETITSMSEGDKIQDDVMNAIPASPVAIEATRAADQREQTEGERAEETESGTTDEVIDVDVCNETIPAQTSCSPNEAKVPLLAQTASYPHSRQPIPAPLPPAGVAADMEKTGMKRPASIASLQDEDERHAPSGSMRAAASDGPKSEGGHPCGRPSASSARDGTANLLSGEAKRRNRWTPTPLPVSTAPPQGVDPESTSSNSPTSPAEQGNQSVAEAPTPQAASQPRPQGPLAVKSKAAKPAMDQQRRGPEQGLINALHSRLQTPPAPSTGLLSIVTARPPAMGTTDPQMPAAPANNQSTHTPTEAAAPTKEIYLQGVEEQSESVDTEITQLAEQRAMHMVHRYQTLSVEMAEKLEALPPVAPPVSLYANLPQEWPLARLSVQLRHIGVLLRVTLYRRVAELSFRGIDFYRLPREVMKDICHDFDNIWLID